MGNVEKRIFRGGRGGKCYFRTHFESIRKNFMEKELKVFKKAFLGKKVRGGMPPGDERNDDVTKP